MPDSANRTDRMTVVPYQTPGGMRPFDPNSRRSELALPVEIAKYGFDVYHILYRFYDSERRLLYVGITTWDPRARWGGHQRYSSWWRSAAFLSVRHLATRDAARDAELEAIRVENPIFNVADRKSIPRPADETSAAGTSAEMPVTCARSLLTELVNRANYRDERIALTRRGRVVAAIVPVADLEWLENLDAQPDEEHRS
ncbi:MAG: hypothetical protein JWN00_2140 [Actinomycetia bacterium]|jgi:prevent-host-death family protein|nr:hypothetical protein [Actinomycetes bacterium]